MSRTPQERHLGGEILDAFSNWYHREGGFMCRGFNVNKELDALVAAILDNDCHSQVVRDDSPDWTAQPRPDRVKV